MTAPKRKQRGIIDVMAVWFIANLAALVGLGIAALKTAPDEPAPVVAEAKAPVETPAP